MARQVTLLVDYPGVPAGTTLTQQDGDPFFRADDGSGFCMEAEREVDGRPDLFANPEDALKVGDTYFYNDDVLIPVKATWGDDAMRDQLRQLAANVFKSSETAQKGALAAKDSFAQEAIKDAIAASAKDDVAVPDAVFEVNP